VNVYVYAKTNSGKGAAIRTALPLATGRFVLIQDADGEYFPSDFPRVLQPLLDGKADLVLGTRFHEYPDSGSLHFVLHRVLNCTFNSMMSTPLTDIETGLKAFRRDPFSQMSYNENRFGFEIEIVAKAIKAGLRVQEVPIGYKRRNYGAGKKFRCRDCTAIPFQVWRHCLGRHQSS
jgi:glycosyltransferase involved in cell wall biosynthesis